jgi:hypothetical protein
MKRAGYIIRVFLLLAALMFPFQTQAGHVRHSLPGAARPTSLEAAMRIFIDALKKRDTRAFLSLFSRSRPFYASNPMNDIRVSVTYSKLASDVRKKRGLYWDYLERGEGGMYDAFVDNIGDGRMWRRAGGNKFVPPGMDASSRTYVKWRLEKSRWVIAEISYPQS